jgi:hypothetical protein
LVIGNGKEGINKYNHPIQNPLLLVTESRTHDIKFHEKLLSDSQVVPPGEMKGESSDANATNIF